MPVLNPWIMVGALALWIGTGLGAYFYGHDQGVKSEKAELADGYQAALDGFVAAAGDAAAKASQGALQDFKDKTSVLDALSRKLDAQKGVINAAATRLTESLKGGSCILDPVQRQLLECVRRPGTSGCATAPAVAAAGHKAL